MSFGLQNGLFTFICCFVLLAPGRVIGQWTGPNAPDTLSFQGILTDTSGVVVPNGNYKLLFKMYKGSTKIWEQTHTNTPVNSGVFDVKLSGSTTWPLDTVAFNEPIDLGITVDSGTELTPRTSLTSTAYALGMRGMYAVSGDIGGGTTAPNLIGGASNNYVSENVVGATIGGGGGWSTANPEPDSVLGNWGTVGGGRKNIAGVLATVGGGVGNTARAPWATIAGGYSNTAGSNYSTVGGGFSNKATGNLATVGGGNQNWASAQNTTIGGGLSNTASSQKATVGGGDSNTASGKGSTVPGGVNNSATKGYTFAAGQNAKANHSGTFVWADSASASGVDFSSTGKNQFLIRASGGVGIGTNSPNTPVDIAGGNNWDVSTTDGDVKIGNDTYRLVIGVASDGLGAGISRINAKGGHDRLILGGGGTDVVRIDATDGVYPGVNNTYALGTSSLKWTEVWATNPTINTSDRRLKHNIQPLRHGLDDVLALNPVSYRWNDNPEAGTRLGLIAQEAVEVLPEVVVAPGTPEGHYGMRYAELVPVLIKAVQELAKINRQQNDRILALEAKLVN